VTVALREVAEFLRTAPARTLDADLRAAVERGTAASVATRLEGTGWRLGGKTGTGPNVVGPTSDGWFAGAVFEGDVPRYTFAVFVEHHGPGGGVAASIAADLATSLARRASPASPISAAERLEDNE
jgi:cell division protein FtsI/penicillin-binding protein 2